MQRRPFAVVRQVEWLLEHFRADVDLCRAHRVDASVHTGCNKLEPACRCWRCGRLLPFELIVPDKVDPAGSTRRSNLRPACARCVGALARAEAQR